MKFYLPGCFKAVTDNALLWISSSFSCLHETYNAYQMIKNCLLTWLLSSFLFHLYQNRNNLPLNIYGNKKNSFKHHSGLLVLHGKRK